tara:strand:+ start:5815 stop:6801 length:987 start_codon:yes stop_codon:yes gene_type:complete
MPPRVYRGKSAYEWHPKGGGAVRLCALDATEADVWLAFRVAQGDVKVKHCQWLADEYFKSKEFADLAPRTKKDYKRYWERLALVFGKQQCNSVKPEHVRRYMDLRAESSVAMANKEKKLLAIMMRYGFERGHTKENPCDPVKNFKEKGRDRYITDAEYNDFYNRASPMCQVMMDISYTCAARSQDVRKIRMADIKKEGLFIEQAKTGKKQVKLWTNRLRAAVTLAKQLRSQRMKSSTSLFLLVTSTGSPYTESGMKSLWRRERANYIKATGKDINWTFHDIKAKAISDYQGDKQQFSGHKSHAMMERYNRSEDTVQALDFSEKPQAKR